MTFIIQLFKKVDQKIVVFGSTQLLSLAPPFLKVEKVEKVY